MDSSAISGVDPTSATAQAYVARTEKLAQDQDRANGESAVALIEAAATPPPAHDGKGTLLNRYA
jgi:hypothetical protein